MSGPTLAKAAEVTHLNKVDVPRRRVTLSPAERRELQASRDRAVKLLDVARAHAGMSAAKMAIACGVAESEMSRALHGERRFDVAWLFCMPQPFKENLMHLLASEWGVRLERPERRQSTRQILDAIQKLVATLED